MEIYEYLWDIKQLEGVSNTDLAKKTGMTTRQIYNFFDTQYKKRSETELLIAAALNLGGQGQPLLARIAAYYKEKLHELLGSAEEIFVKIYNHLPEKERRYVRALASTIFYELKEEREETKNGSV